MVGFLNAVRFLATTTGAGDFVVDSAVTGYQTPATANATNGETYRYRAESEDLSQWEVGYGVYTSSTATLARTTIVANSLGGSSAINFTAAPQVGIVFLKEDFDSVFDDTLTSIAALTPTTDQSIYFSGTDTAAVYSLTSFGRSLVDDTTAANAATTLGLGTGDSPQFTAVNIGHATDTTLTRVSAGVAAIEGSNILLASGLGSITQAYDAELAALAGLTSAADKVPYFTGSGTAAVGDFTTFGRSLVDDANASAARTTLGLVIGTDVQAQDAELAAIAGLTSAADKVPYFTGSGTAAVADFTSYGRSIAAVADEAAFKALVNLEIGTDVQAQDAELAALAGLTSAADRVPYFTGSGTAALGTFTAAGRSMVAAASATAQTALLDAVVGDSGSGGTKGMVPAPAAGDAAAEKFLKADGTWEAPAGAGDVVGPASSTDNAATRFDSTTGKLLQNSALIIADTTGALSRSGGGGIPVQGTNTNSDAAAGNVGQILASAIESGSAVSVTTSTDTNVTSISLTAGDWDVSGIVYFVPAASASVTIASASISQTSATRDTAAGAFANFATAANVIPATFSVALPPWQIKLTSTTTVYLVARATFTVGTMTAYGRISARRPQ